jgi:hypothetical protein
MRMERRRWGLVVLRAPINVLPELQILLLPDQLQGEEEEGRKEDRHSSFLFRLTAMMPASEGVLYHDIIKRARCCCRLLQQ